MLLRGFIVVCGLHAKQNADFTQNEKRNKKQRTAIKRSIIYIIKIYLCYSEVKEYENGKD